MTMWGAFLRAVEDVASTRGKAAALGPRVATTFGPSAAALSPTPRHRRTLGTSAAAAPP